MPADLKKPFNESCCDGGECGPNDMSAQPCGCDRGAGWICERHQREVIATPQAKRYTISLEVAGPGGNPVECKLSLTPTGSYDTNLDSYWTRLLDNLGEKFRIIAKG